MKFLSVITILICTSQAFAAELITCRSIDGIQLESQLRVYETAGGYVFSASTCQMPKPPILTMTNCEPYQLNGAVERQKIDAAGQVFETLHFSNDRVEILPSSGGFRLTDHVTGQVLEFSAADCSI